jgi:enoyl-CoA hydratase/carnithine racemase
MDQSGVDTRYQYLSGEKKDHIYTICINRPEKRNAMPFDMLADICMMVENQITDPQVRVILVRGEGSVFSAGVDFDSLATLVGRFRGETAAGGAPIRAEIHKYQQYLNRLEAIELPIICAIHGGIFGMALEFALACDIRLMSEDCRWGLPELQFGIIADLGGTSRLARALGASRAMEVLMTSRRYTAGEALQWGLVNHVYPEEVLFDRAEQLADDIAKTAPIAVGAVKRIIKQGEGVDLMTQLDMEVNLQSVLLRSDDFEEGIKALLEKRSPDWRRK